MKRPHRRNPLAVALYLNAAALFAILAVLLARDSNPPLLPMAMAQPALERLLFQLQMLVTVSLLAWLLRKHSLVRRESGVARNHSVNWTIRGIRAAAALFSVALAADLLGYAGLGRFVADGTLGCIYTAVILYAGVQVVYGLIRLALNVWPLQNLWMVRNLKGTVERRARRRRTS